MRGWQLAAGAILGLGIGFLVWGGRDGDPQKSEPETPEVVAPALGEDSALSGALELAARAMGDSAPHRRTQNR